MIFAYLLSEDGNGTEDTDDMADGSNQTNNRWSVKTGKNLKQQKKKQENLIGVNERKINEKFQWRY